MSSPINEILPNLFISDSVTHTTNEFYKKFNIKYIVNCSKDLPDIDRIILDKNSIEYIKIPINEEGTDHNNRILNSNIEAVCRNIHKHLINLSGVLVYCYSANQCSPSVIAAYLIKYCGINDVNLAVYYIRTKRPYCFLPRINFYDALNALVYK